MRQFIPNDANWIATEYNNQSAPASFFNIGAEEEQSGDFGPEPLDRSVPLCPDVSAPTYTISGQVTLSGTGQGLQGVSL